MILFFQTRSWWSVALAWRHVRRASRVVFHHRAPLGELPLRPAPDPGMRLVRLLNRDALIEEVNQEQLYALGFYQNNFESDVLVERVFERVERSGAYSLVREVVGDQRVANFFKMRLLDPIREQACFWRAVPTVLRGRGTGAAVPATNDSYGLTDILDSGGQVRRLVPWGVRAARSARRTATRWLAVVSLWNPLRLAALPLAYLTWLILRRGIAFKSVPFRTDVAMPLIWGFGKDGVVRGRRRHDNGYLANESLPLDRFLFFFSDWTFEPEERRTLETFMERQGIRYCDPREFSPTPGYLREAFVLCVRLWWGLARRPWILWDDPWFVAIAAALLYHYLQEMLFTRSVEYRVLLEYQDYLSAHVLRTILAERSGRVTVGLHHNEPDGPYLLPALRYVRVSRYCLWGEAFRRLYAPYWEDLGLEAVGAPRLDYVVNALASDGCNELDRRFAERYGGRRPLIVLLFPGLSRLNVPARVTAMLDGLSRVLEVGGDLTIVCRFKAPAHLEAFLEKGLAGIMKADPRIVVDMTDFTTYEWFALSDAVIVNSASTGMIEAAAAGKPCFTFDYQMIAEIVYARFGTDLILRTADDLVRVVKQVRQGFIGWDCRWDQLAKDYCYFADGRNLDRFRRVILDALAEVEGRRLREETAG